MLHLRLIPQGDDLIGWSLSSSHQHCLGVSFFYSSSYYFHQKLGLQTQTRVRDNQLIPKKLSRTMKNGLIGRCVYFLAQLFVGCVVDHSSINYSHFELTSVGTSRPQIKNIALSVLMVAVAGSKATAALDCYPLFFVFPFTSRTIVMMELCNYGVLNSLQRRTREDSTLGGALFLHLIFCLID